MLLNIGFGLIIFAALFLLLAAWGASWYNDHLTASATVNGQTITKDAFAKQVAINTFRAGYQKSRLRTLLAANQIRPSDAETRQAIIDQRLAQIEPLSLEQLVDGTVQAELATKQGLTISEDDVSKRVTEEATTPELRRAWMIAVTPQLESGKSLPTDEAKAAAKATAEKALADLKAGGDWETIAKEVSTDASASQAGDLGFIDKASSLDSAFRAALLAAAKDAPTDVVEGADGTFRVGRVTEIRDPVVDATLEQQVKDKGIDLADFRAAIRRDLTRDRLEEAVLAPYLAAAPQRDVQQIYLAESQSESGPGAVRVRHILYSPNGDPAAASTVPADDPAWADAEAKAKATYEKLRADLSQFDAIARAESDEGAARTSGGKLPYFSSDDVNLDPAFWAAISKEGLQPGQLLEPVRSAFGWHVIQVQRFPPEVDFAASLKDDIAAGTVSFEDAARESSDAPDSAQGGKLGWVTKGQLAKTLEDAIFAAPVGQLADPVTVEGEGIYIFRVNGEETRTPSEEQANQLRSTIFADWYATEKDAFDVTRDPGITGATG
jgi:parvulin-like peptidyl-prolyl isomerase